MLCFKYSANILEKMLINLSAMQEFLFASIRVHLRKSFAFLYGFKW